MEGVDLFKLEKSNNNRILLIEDYGISLKYYYSDLNGDFRLEPGQYYVLRSDGSGTVSGFATGDTLSVKSFYANGQVSLCPLFTLDKRRIKL